VSYELNFGDSVVGAGRAAFIDDQRFGARESDMASLGSGEGTTAMPGAKLYLVSAGLTDISALLPPGVSPCECSFMRWGFWGGDFTHPETMLRERVHLGQWVAGTLATAVEIQGLSGGSAIFNGHAIADVINNGRTYKAGGAFSMMYNFNSSGMVNITNLDGINYAASVAPPFVGAEHLPQGTLTSGPISGPIYLGFFHGPMGPASGVGGNFKVTDGSGYQAIGIVAGQQ
jgi:hypothetical protein